MAFQGIHVHRAYRLTDEDWGNRKSDPYFICRIGSLGSSWKEKKAESEGIQFRSNTIPNDLNPEWDAMFTIDLSADWVKLATMINRQLTEGLELTLKIFDRDHAAIDDNLGSLTIGIPKDQQDAMDFPIIGGTGYVTIEFYTAQAYELKNCRHPTSTLIMTDSGSAAAFAVRKSDSL